jgi:hypothetical protein
MRQSITLHYIEIPYPDKPFPQMLARRNPRRLPVLFNSQGKGLVSRKPCAGTENLRAGHSAQAQGIRYSPMIFTSTRLRLPPSNSP